MAVREGARLRVVRDLVEVRSTAGEQMLGGEDREQGRGARSEDEQDERSPPGPGVAVDRGTLSDGRATLRDAENGVVMTEGVPWGSRFRSSTIS